jgi:hypothetical protein
MASKRLAFIAISIGSFPRSPIAAAFVLKRALSFVQGNFLVLIADELGKFNRSVRLK